MKSVIKVLAAVAVVSTPLFAMEPTLETQKHDSSLMMDGMKSLNSKVEATWVSKEQTESAAKESAATLKEAKTEIAPAVASAKAALDAQKGSINTTLPALPNKESRKAEKVGAAVAGVGFGGLCLWVGNVLNAMSGNGTPSDTKVLLIATGLGLAAAAAGYGIVHGVKKIGQWLFS